MPPVDVESPPDAPAANSLEYVRASAPVTRRQFRFLLFLTLLNTILLAAFVCAPTVSSFVRSSWQEYQSKRRLSQLLQQQSALLQKAATFTAPADEVLYEDNPAEAAKLLSASSDYSTLPNSGSDIVYLPPQPWQPPVYRQMQPVATQL